MPRAKRILKSSPDDDSRRYARFVRFPVTQQELEQLTEAAAYDERTINAFARIYAVRAAAKLNQERRSVELIGSIDGAIKDNPAILKS